jgi:Tol biopolymer transport system component
VADDNNHAVDVFVRDMNATAAQLVSARHATLPQLTSYGFSAVTTHALSPNGRRALFVNSSRNDGRRDLLAYDFGTPAYSTAPAYSPPSMSADGHMIAFESTEVDIGASPMTLPRGTSLLVRDLNLRLAQARSVDQSWW